MLDDGRLTDNKGRTANFKNTIIIMTSNLGSQMIREFVEERGKQGADSDTVLTDKDLSTLQGNVFNLLKQTIRPEFLNRIDETIMFLPLTRTQIADVVRLQLENLKKMLAPQGFQLEATPQAIDYLADEGYDPEFGARPVKRAIQRLVLNDLSKQLLAGKVTHEKPIIIDSFGEGIVFRN